LRKKRLRIYLFGLDINQGSWAAKTYQALRLNIFKFFVSDAFMIKKSFAHDDVMRLIHTWLSQFVLPLNLCPFAREPFEKDTIRISVFDGETPKAALDFFKNELALLQTTSVSELETSLLAFPQLTEFESYLGLLDYLNDHLLERQANETFQLASFHPGYVFEGVEEGDASNYTNRAPVPIVHILRQEEMTKRIAEYGDVSVIPERNIAKMYRLGEAEIQRLLNGEG
jgi:hypothetical protein